MATHTHTPESNSLAIRSILSQDEWDELHDALELALDALGDGPSDVNYDYLINCMMHQRIGLKITHKKARGMGADA